MIKKILRNLHRYVLWAIVSIVFWTWIFSRIVDAPASRKVVLYADLPTVEAETLSDAMEPALPEGIRFLEVNLFGNAVFSPSAVTRGDLYVVPESNVEMYLASFAPIDKSAFPDAVFYEKDGVAYGVCLFDRTTGLVHADAYFRFSPYLEDDRCYLFFGTSSKHIGEWNGSADDAAIAVAQRILQTD